MYMYMYICIFVYLYESLYLYISRSVYLYMYMYICIYTYAYVYIYIYMYDIYTHISIYIYSSTIWLTTVGDKLVALFPRGLCDTRRALRLRTLPRRTWIPWVSHQKTIGKWWFHGDLLVV